MQSETVKSALGQDQSNFSKERETLEALAWTSVACFIVEILCMFGGGDNGGYKSWGESFFRRRVESLNSRCEGSRGRG